VNIELKDCPQILQDAVEQRLSRIGYAKIIAVTKHEATPYRDESRIETRYKVYLQAGYEFLILTTSITTGGSPLDGDVSFNIVNANDIQTIINTADYIKEDIERLLNRE